MPNNIAIFSLCRALLQLSTGACRSRETRCNKDGIALEYDRYLRSAAAEAPVKFQSDWKSLNPNLAASRLHEILR